MSTYTVLCNYSLRHNTSSITIRRNSSSNSCFRYIMYILFCYLIYLSSLLMSLTRLNNTMSSRAVVFFLPPLRCLIIFYVSSLTHSFQKFLNCSTINVGQILNFIAWIAVIWQRFEITDDFFLLSGQLISVRSHRFYADDNFVYQKGITQK